MRTPSWLDRHRDMLFEAALYAALLLSTLMVLAGVFMIFSTKSASSATCASRPGVSSGSTWWRFRYRNGVRCWYAGARHASRRSRLVVRQRTGLTASEDKPGEHASRMLIHQAANLEPRTVRAILVINGLTVHERIERAFDRFVIMPAEDEP